MSSKPTKNTPAKPHTKHSVPIVNVFDEDQPTSTLQPARRPVVVEIEDVPTQLQSPTIPPMPQQPAVPTVTSPFPQEPMPQRPIWQQETEPTTPAPVAPQPQMMPQTEPVSNLATPDFGTPPVVNVAPQGMNAEPMLPSFFEHDLKNGVAATAAPIGTPQDTNTNPSFSQAAGTMPQAVVGEINEAAQGDGGSNKKLIGIVLMVLAVLILAIGGLFLYARNLFSPTTLPTPTPEVIATPRPTPDEMTPPPTASTSATLSASESAALKKKVKVDVLNGTKTAGLATKQASVLKAAGFVTGTVGNGKAEEAGTIVYPAAYAGLVTEIKTLLKDMTFTASASAKATTIVVTLGQ